MQEQEIGGGGAPPVSEPVAAEPVAAPEAPPTPDQIVDDICRVFGENEKLLEELNKAGHQIPRRYLPQRNIVEHIFDALDGLRRFHKSRATEARGRQIMERTFAFLNQPQRVKIIIEKIITGFQNLPVALGEFWRNLIEDEGLTGLGGMLGVWDLRCQVMRLIPSTTTTQKSDQLETTELENDIVGKTIQCLIETIYSAYNANQDKIRDDYRPSTKFYRRKARDKKLREAEVRAGSPDMGFFSALNRWKNPGRFKCRQQNPRIRLFVGQKQYIDISLEELDLHLQDIGYLMAYREVKIDPAQLKARNFDGRIFEIDDPDNGLITTGRDGKPVLKLDDNPPLVSVVIRKAGADLLQHQADHLPFFATGQLASLVLVEQYNLRGTHFDKIKVHFNHAGLDGGPGLKLTKTMLDNLHALPVDYDRPEHALSEYEAWEPTSAYGLEPIILTESVPHGINDPVAPGMEVYRTAMELAGLVSLTVAWGFNQADIELVEKARAMLGAKLKQSPASKAIAGILTTERLDQLITPLETIERIFITPSQREQLARLRRIKAHWFENQKEAIGQRLSEEVDAYCPRTFLNYAGIMLGQEGKTVQVCVESNDRLVRLNLFGLLTDPDLTEGGLEAFEQLVTAVRTTTRDKQTPVDMDSFLRIAALNITQTTTSSNLKTEIAKRFLNLVEFFADEVINARDSKSIVQYLALLSGRLQKRLTDTGRQLAPTLTDLVAGGHSQLSVLSLDDPVIIDFTSALSEKQMESLAALKAKGESIKKIKTRLAINNRLVREIILNSNIGLTEEEEALRTDLQELDISALGPKAAEEEISAVLQQWTKEHPNSIGTLQPKIQEAIKTRAALEVEAMYKATILFAFLNIYSLATDAAVLEPMPGFEELNLTHEQLETYYALMTNRFKLKIANQIMAEGAAATAAQQINKTNGQS